LLKGDPNVTPTEVSDLQPGVHSFASDLLHAI
jgi:hypothetical protein